MNYEPQVNDTITREGFPPITITLLTKGTAKYLYKGDEQITPREIFDKQMAESMSAGATVTRDGVPVYPPTEELITSQIAAAEDDASEKILGILKDTGTSGSHNTHARLAPSHSKTWATCTAALAYCEANKRLIPEDTGSIYAAEGTEAHDHAADVLMKKKTLDQIPAEMREPVGEYVAHCLALVPDGVRYEVEVQCPLFYQKDSKGTADFAIVTDERITVRDYKHGMGVLTTSFQNSQLAIYAYSLLCHLEDIYDFTDDTVIDIKVVQPRHHMAENDEPWITTLGEFRKFCAEIEVQAKVATIAVDMVREGEFVDGAEPSDIISVAPIAEFVPQDGDGGSCRWCKAKAFCGVRHESNTGGSQDTSAMLALMPDMTETLDMEVVPDSEIVPKDGETLKLEYLAAVLKNRKKIEKWLKDVDDYLTRLDVDTLTGLGFKYVQGRQGNRAWADEDAAEVFTKGQKLKIEERCTIKLKSPTQIAALLKDKLKNTRTSNRFEELVTRSEGKPVLVPEDDKRPALPTSGDVMPNMEDDI